MPQGTDPNTIIADMTNAFIGKCKHKLYQGGRNVLNKFIDVAVLKGIKDAGGYNASNKSYLICRFECIAERVNDDPRGMATREVLIDTCDAEYESANKPGHPQNPNDKCDKLPVVTNEEKPVSEEEKRVMVKNERRRRRLICKDYTRAELEAVPPIPGEPVP